jgi:hypothetical protein
MMFLDVEMGIATKIVLVNQNPETCMHENGHEIDVKFTLT